MSNLLIESAVDMAKTMNEMASMAITETMSDKKILTAMSDTDYLMLTKAIKLITDYANLCMEQARVIDSMADKLERIESMLVFKEKEKQY